MNTFNFKPTVKDVVERYKGVWPFNNPTHVSMLWSRDEFHVEGWSGTISSRLNDNHWAFICSKEQFLQCADDMSSIVLAKTDEGLVEAKLLHTVTDSDGKLSYACMQITKPEQSGNLFWSEDVITKKDQVLVQQLIKEVNDANFSEELAKKIIRLGWRKP